MKTYKVMGWIKTDKGCERLIAEGFDSIAEAARWIVGQAKVEWLEVHIYPVEQPK